ncbi:MAG: SCO family protein [Wenzhouxiangella sp.]
MNDFTPARRQSGRVFLLVVIAIAAIAGGIVVSSNLFERSQTLRHAQAFPEARKVSEFELQTADGESFGRDDLEGRWSLVFFGFTNCPDICPDTLALLARSMDELRGMGREELPQVVFVSVDPARDQGEQLADYVAWFDEDFIGVTGSEDQLESLSRQLGAVYFRETPDEETGFYNVDHSASVLIIDPEARLFGRFAPPLAVEDITADLFSLTR